MSQLSPSERAIAAAKAENKEGVDFEVARQFPFLNGEVYRVEWHQRTEAEDVNKKDDQEGDDDYFVWVYVTDDTETLIVDADAVEFVATHPGRSKTATDILYAIVRNSGVSSLIAVLITVTICTLTVLNAGSNSSYEPPEILGNALTMILGFYFGRATSHSKMP